MNETIRARHDALSEEYATCTNKARINAILREMAVLEMAMISQHEPVVPEEWEEKAGEATARLPLVQQRERRMEPEGVAVEFATHFVTHHWKEFAAGPFEVSAERHGVMVHRATLITEADFEAFQEAMIRAKAAHVARRGGWGGAS